MSLLYNIEGPKGSGKSTLSNLLKEHKQNIEVRHFDSKNTLSKSLLDSDSSSFDDFIYDRGWLSSLIYGWANDAYLLFDTSSDFTQVTLTSWSPLTLKHFKYLMDKITHKFIILYSSDDKILYERIKMRSLTENKGATSEELASISLSNVMYKNWGNILYHEFPEKILLLDIALEETSEELISKIENLEL